MLGPTKCQRHRMRTSGNYDMPGLNRLFAERDRISPREASFAVKRAQRIAFRDWLARDR